MTAAEERAEIMERLERIEGKVDTINGTVKDHENRIVKTEEFIEDIDEHVKDFKKWAKRIFAYVVAPILLALFADIDVVKENLPLLDNLLGEASGQ